MLIYFIFTSIAWSFFLVGLVNILIFLSWFSQWEHSKVRLSISWAPCLTLLSIFQQTQNLCPDKKTKQKKPRRNFKDDPFQTFPLSVEKDTPKEVKWVKFERGEWTLLWIQMSLRRKKETERRRGKRKLTLQVSKDLAAGPCVFIPLSLHNSGQHLYAQVVQSAFPGIVYLTFVITALGRCLYYSQFIDEETETW